MLIEGRNPAPLAIPGFPGFKVWAFILFSLAFPLAAVMKSIDCIAEILTDIDAGSIVLLDIDETLIETPVMLGSKAWRSYIRKVLRSEKTEDEVREIHDRLTCLIAQKIGYVAIEKEAPRLILELQQRKIPVFGFTARSKEHWYDLPFPSNIALTMAHLGQGGFDFNCSQIPACGAILRHPSYAQGVFFAYPIEDKGELALAVFGQVELRPSKVIFVDDKRENVEAVDKAFKQMDIPALCYWYRHIEFYRLFDPMIAHIQLERLLIEGVVLSDEEARQIQTDYTGKDPEEFFLELIANHYLDFVNLS